MISRNILISLLFLSLFCIHTLGTCDSTIDARLTQLVAAQRQVNSQEYPHQVLVKEMMRLYQPFQSILEFRPIHEFSDKDLEALFEATNLTNFYAMNQGLEKNMFSLVVELQKRSIVAQRHIAATYDALVGARDWKTAAQWSSRFSGVDLATAPPNLSNIIEDNGQRLVLAFPKNGAAIEVEKIAIPKGVAIIAVTNPNCHFSANAVAALIADPLIFSEIKNITLWLAPQDRGLDFARIVAWNKVNPDIQYKAAYRSSHFPEVDSWDTPTFYFFKSGKEVAKVVGWPRGASLVDFKKALLKLDIRTSHQ